MVCKKYTVGDYIRAKDILRRAGSWFSNGREVEEYVDFVVRHYGYDIFWDRVYQDMEKLLVKLYKSV